MLADLAVLDDILDRHALALGDDFLRYRNHAYRVANFHWSLDAGSASDLETVAIAVAFHDLGLWTANTFDYLAPSEQLAVEFLQARDMHALVPLVVAMIDHHHQLSAVDTASSRLVETFRRADWIDVSAGLVRFGLPSSAFKQINAAYPRLGFHRRLLRFGLAHAVRHPLDPLPMFRL